MGNDSLLSKKLAESLVLSDTEHDLAMQINENGSQEPAANPKGVSHRARSSDPDSGGKQTSFPFSHYSTASWLIHTFIYALHSFFLVHSHTPASAPHTFPERAVPLTQ